MNQADQAQITYVRSKAAHLRSATSIKNAILYEFGRAPSLGALEEIEKVIAARSCKPKQPRMPKERQPRKLLNTERNAAIFRDRAGGMSIGDLADEYGLTRDTISDVLRGKQKS